MTPAERRDKAMREVDALKRETSRLTRRPIDWRDEGDVVYSEQFHQPSRLSAFAAWFDHQGELPEFSEAPNGNYYEHPVWKLQKPKARRFPTLVEHNLNNGYLLPVAFDGVYSVEPYKVRVWEFFRSVASTATGRPGKAILPDRVRTTRGGGIS